MKSWLDQNYTLWFFTGVGVCILVYVFAAVFRSGHNGLIIDVCTKGIMPVIIGYTCSLLHNRRHRGSFLQALFIGLPLGATYWLGYNFVLFELDGTFDVRYLWVFFPMISVGGLIEWIEGGLISRRW